jgi:hypothetical protein
MQTFANIFGFSHSSEIHSENKYQFKWLKENSLPSGLYFIKLEDEGCQGIKIFL